MLTQHADLKQDVKLASKNKSNDQKSTKSNNKKSGTETESDEEEKKQAEKPTPSRALHEIADGAMSDSEIDRQRYDSVCLYHLYKQTTIS